MTPENIAIKAEQIRKIVTGSSRYDRDAALYALGDLEQEIERLTASVAAGDRLYDSYRAQWRIESGKYEERIEQLEGEKLEWEQQVARIETSANDACELRDQRISTLEATLREKEREISEFREAIIWTVAQISDREMDGLTSEALADKILANLSVTASPEEK